MNVKTDNAISIINSISYTLSVSLVKTHLGIHEFMKEVGQKNLLVRSTC